jgi:tetratricopeptide (TPR) repeat protein
VFYARTGQAAQTVHAAVPAVASFSPDATQLALAGKSDDLEQWGALEVVDLTRNEVRFRWEGSGIADMSWSPDGRLLAIAGYGGRGDDGESAWSSWVHVLDTVKRQRTWKLHHGTSRGVAASAVTWSPDGQRLVSGDQDGLAEVWAVSTGQKIASAPLHTAGINTLAWSPDGRRIASGSMDRTVRVWDPTRGEELLRFEFPSAHVTGCQWSPDGRRLAASGADGTIRIWDASAGYLFLNSQEYVREQTRATQNEATEALAQLNATLAEVDSDTGQFDTIELLLSEAQRLADVPSRQSAVNSAFSVLGEKLQGRGHLERAENVFRRALAIAEKLTADSPANTYFSMQHFDSCLRLGRLLSTTGRAQQARELYRQAVAVAERFMADHPNDGSFRGRAAEAYELAGEHDKAEPILGEDAARTRTESGESQQTAGALARLGQCLLQGAKFAEAEPVLRECVAIGTKVLPDDWLLFNATSMLGEALLGQSKLAEAEPLLVQGYAGLRAREASILPQVRSQRLSEARRRVIRLYEARNEPGRAAALLRTLDLDAIMPNGVAAFESPIKEK